MRRSMLKSPMSRGSFLSTSMLHRSQLLAIGSSPNLTSLPHLGATLYSGATRAHSIASAGTSTSWSLMLQHSSDLFTIPTLGTFLYSPYGTLVLCLLAYNIVVTGSGHIAYTLDMLVRDYIQDHVMYTAMKYAIILSLIALIADTVVEV